MRAWFSRCSRITDAPESIDDLLHRQKAQHDARASFWAQLYVDVQREIHHGEGWTPEKYHRVKALILDSPEDVTTRLVLLRWVYDLCGAPEDWDTLLREFQDR